MIFPSTGNATRSRLKPFPDFVGQAAPILVKKDFLLEPSRTTKASNAGLLLLIFSFVHPATIAGFMEELETGKPAARQNEELGSAAKWSGPNLRAIDGLSGKQQM